MPNTVCSKAQRQLIAIGCRNLGISSGLRHDMLRERYGVESSTQISVEQAKEFLKELQQKGFRIQSKNPVWKRGPVKAEKTVKTRNTASCGNCIRLATQEEKEKIAILSNLIEWRAENGFELWMQKRMGVDKVRTSDDAYLIIEGLKKMFENAMKKQHGPDWWIIEQTDPGIIKYIIEHRPIQFELTVWRLYGG